MRLPRCILASFQDRRSSLAIAILERSRSRYSNSSAYIFHYPIFAIFLSSSFLLDIYLIRDSKFSDFYLWTLTYSINPLHSNVIYSIFLNCKRCIENVIIFLFRKRRTMWKSDFKRSELFYPQWYANQIFFHYSITLTQSFIFEYLRWILLCREFQSILLLLEL